MTPSEQAHFKLLQAIESNPDVTQRELAKLLGVSKGKTNYLIGALIEKGLIKIGNFQRSGGKIGKLVYLLTAEGARDRMAMTRAYLVSKEAEYAALKIEIEALRAIENGIPDGALGDGS